MEEAAKSETAKDKKTGAVSRGPATSLHEAAGRPSSRLSMHRFIEAEGVDPRDADGRTPLHMAAGVGVAGAIRILLARGADPKSRDDSGNTPLHYAALLPSPLAARLLVAVGADPDAVNECGISPRDVAQSQAMAEALEPRKPSAKSKAPARGPEFLCLRPQATWKARPSAADTK